MKQQFICEREEANAKAWFIWMSNLCKLAEYFITGACICMNNITKTQCWIRLHYLHHNDIFLLCIFCQEILVLIYQHCVNVIVYLYFKIYIATFHLNCSISVKISIFSVNVIFICTSIFLNVLFFVFLFLMDSL